MDYLGQLLAGALVMAALYAFIAVGFSIIFSVNRVFHFALATSFPLAGYVAYSLSDAIGLPLAMLAGVVVACLSGVFCEVAIYRTLRRRRTSGTGLLLASLGMQFLLQGLIGAVWGTDSLYMSKPFVDAPIQLGPVTISELDACAVGVAVIVVAATLGFLYRSAYGRTLVAVAEAPGTAEVVGIPIQRVRVAAVVLGTLIATPAAFFMGFQTGLTPDMGSVPLLFAFASVVVGGIGKVKGTVLGLLLLVFASTAAVYFLPAYWMQGVTFLILLGFMLWRPRGLLGAVTRTTQA